MSDVCDKTNRVYLTNGLKTLKSGIKVAICKQIISVEKVKEIVKKAIDEQIWQNDEDKARLDSVFLTNAQFVPETDPTGDAVSDLTMIPVNYALYGNTFNGGYYIVDLFSSKQFFDEMLDATDIMDIQYIMNNVGLQYNIMRLSDRVGNIVCRFDIEVITHKNTKMSPEGGISGEIRLNEKYNNRILTCLFVVIQENDGTIISHTIEKFTLNEDNPTYEYIIGPNRYHNRIMMVDSESNLIYYAAERDYSYGSNYYSLILPQQYSVQSSKREVDFYGRKRSIDITNMGGMGDICVPKEVYETEKRQQKWKDAYNADKHFFSYFESGENERAIQVIINIINSIDLLWDLKLIWLIDPYLSAEDILNTVVYSQKKGIKIRCLTDLGSIQENKHTRVRCKEGLTNYQSVKENYKSILEAAIPLNSDLDIEFRTVYGGNGSKFHDRYVVCQYGINKCRAWSLGTSVNAIGKNHHIIQIVESPNEVLRIIQNMWDKTDGERGLIFKNSISV